MGRKVPKMFLPLCGRPILYWTLFFLDRCPTIHRIVLAVPPEYRARVQRKIQNWKFDKVHAVVAGGQERADSTRNALRALPAGTIWVGIHDAARPFVSENLIRRVYQGARPTGCACLAVPSKDTVKLSQPSRPRIEKTLPRARCWLAQTPQVFRREIAEKIHRNSPRARFTDDASLAESKGYSVALVPGSYENIKITTQEDLSLAERILKSRRVDFR